MNNKKGKIISVFLIIISLINININLYAHSGRTDSSGGIRNNKTYEIFGGGTFCSGLYNQRFASDTL